MFIHIRKRMSVPPRANGDVEGGKSDSLSCKVTHALMNITGNKLLHELFLK